MRVLVVIPARGGSKGVPRKNIKLLGGKPLIQYTIEAAREVFPDDVICVSTDDDEIKRTVEQIGLHVPFIRPKELANDSTGTYEVLLHAINFYKRNGYDYDVLVLLQPTSPFRTSQQIRDSLNLFTHDIDMIVSVKEAKSNPYFTLFEENDHGYLLICKEGNFVRRQDCPRVYEMNGAIYIIKIHSLIENPINKLKKRKKYLMDEISSHDIDTIFDWYIAEHIITEKHKLLENK